MLHKIENILCTKLKICVAQNGKIYAAQNRKYTLQERENIGCTKRKIFAAQSEKYTLHKTESILCRKGKYTSHKREYKLKKAVNGTVFLASIHQCETKT